MKPDLAPFGNGIVCLRLIEEKDLETTLSWRNRDEARVWFKTPGRLSSDQHRSWFKHYLMKDDDFLFVIEAEGKLVGQASVYAIDWQGGTAEVGRFLAAPDGGGRGYIGQACSELVLLCREKFNLKNVFLEVLETNERAIRLYKRCGFSEEQRYDGLIRMGRSTAFEESI